MLLTTAASLVLALSPDPERHLAAALQPAPETELTHGPDASLQLETCLKGHDKAWCLERHPQEQSVQRQRAPGPAGAGAGPPAVHHSAAMREKVPGADACPKPGLSRGTARAGMEELFTSSYSDPVTFGRRPDVAGPAGCACRYCDTGNEKDGTRAPLSPQHVRSPQSHKVGRVRPAALCAGTAGVALAPQRTVAFG